MVRYTPGLLVDYVILMILDGELYAWTSGRLCDFDGCDDDPSLNPRRDNGWFWSGSGTRMSTKSGMSNWGKRSFQRGVSQPDDREGHESCVSILAP